MGLDFVSALQWAVDNQGTLCKSGPGSDDNRPGTVFPKGICFDTMNDESENSLKKVVDIIKVGNGVLRGPYNVLYQTIAGTTQSVNVNYLRFAANPVQDIRSVVPTTFNACGNGTGGLQDKTIGGLLSNGDAETVLKKTGALGRACEILQ